MASLASRVRKLEQRHPETVTDLRRLTDEELLWHVRKGLELAFAAGEYPEEEQKIRAYEAAGKSFADIDKEEPEWFMRLLKKVAEEKSEP